MPKRVRIQHTDPGHAATVALGQKARQHAVLGHGHGQSRVAHHERIEHADATDDAAGHNASTGALAAKERGRVVPVAGRET